MTVTGQDLLTSEISHPPHLGTSSMFGTSETMTPTSRPTSGVPPWSFTSEASSRLRESWFDQFSCPTRRPQMTTFVSLLDHLYEGDVVDSADLARVCGTKPHSVIGWRHQETTPTREAEERLLETRAVVDLVRRVMHDDAARSWIRSPNRNMGYEKPLDLIEAGDYHRVIGSLLALAEGVTT